MSTYSLYWTVSEVERSTDYITRRNIKKHIVFPRYQGSIGEIEIPLAYIGSKEIDPPSNLHVVKLEDSIVENSRLAFSGEAKWRGKLWYTSSRYFLITDVVADYVSSEPEPLYWKHVLPDPNITSDSAVILDSNLEEVPERSYEVVQIQERDSSDVLVADSYEDCSIYSNYLNTYNEDTGELEIYFVRYEVSGTTHYQLLNQVPAFSEAGVDDISSVSGMLKPWRKVYIITTYPAHFSVSTPRADTDYYLKYLERSRIVVHPPVDQSDEAPWSLNVSNGAFIRIVSGETYNYSIPEFASQSFSPLYPYKVMVEEEADQLQGDVLKIYRTPMQVDSSLYSMDVLIKDVSNQTLYALTTDSSKSGTDYTESGNRIARTIGITNSWVTWDGDGIIGWDVEGGFVHLQKEYPDTYKFYVSYYYEETGYDVVGLNVNPIFDEEYREQFYVLYIVPTGGANSNTTTQTASVHYLKVNRSGQVIDTSQTGLYGNFGLSPTINSGDYYMYYSLNASSVSTAINYSGQNFVGVDDASDFPESGIVVWTNPSTGVLETKGYLAKVSNSLMLDGVTLDDDVPGGTTFRLHSFVEPYTTGGDNRYQWLILAEVHVSASSRVDELSIIDLREIGGVVKEKYHADSMAIDPRSIWARPGVMRGKGQAIPGDSAAVVKIPYTLLEEYGGDFKQEDIESIVEERHLAAGIIPVIIYDGAIPEITSITSTTTTATVNWASEGTTYSYNVYYSSKKAGPWTKLTSTPLSDQTLSSYYYSGSYYSTSNYYTASGLTSGVKYYFTVTAVSDTGVEGPYGVAWGIRTRTA